MKFIDCTTYYSEDLMLDIRFNILNEFVDKFIIVESKFSHSGQPKKLNFDINKFQKFKDKIEYLVIENEPDGIKENIENSSEIKRKNSLLRIEQSYDFIMNALNDVNDNDLVCLSDNDEIPNFNSEDFKKSNNDIFIFKQLFFYYKFNLFYDLIPWYGTKACRKKKLLSFSWLRNLKNKKYPFWRLDTLFSKNRYINIEIINDGGWHFTNLMTAEKMFEKYTNFGHHDEFQLSGLTVEDLQKKIDNKEMFFNHFVDKEKYKERWNFDYKLKKISDDKLPEYLQSREIRSKLKQWFD